MILYLALSFCAPSSRYARYLPSLSLILGDVRGGPPGEPQSFGGGGRRIAWSAQPRSTIGRTKTNLGAILFEIWCFKLREDECGSSLEWQGKYAMRIVLYSTSDLFASELQKFAVMHHGKEAQICHVVVARIFCLLSAVNLPWQFLAG
uniref:Uncharacterized protein n=1 Tax=Arundo donax TaxID=35708 RepID=A0A0A9AMG3_ARUDO